MQMSNITYTYKTLRFNQTLSKAWIIIFKGHARTPKDLLENSILFPAWPASFPVGFPAPTIFRTARRSGISPDRISHKKQNGRMSKREPPALTDDGPGDRAPDAAPLVGRGQEQPFLAGMAPLPENRRLLSDRVRHVSIDSAARAARRARRCGRISWRVINDARIVPLHHRQPGDPGPTLRAGDRSDEARQG
jgi:hypothetical protein